MNQLPSNAEKPHRSTKTVCLDWDILRRVDQALQCLSRELAIPLPPNAAVAATDSDDVKFSKRSAMHRRAKQVEQIMKMLQEAPR